MPTSDEVEQPSAGADPPAVFSRWTNVVFDRIVPPDGPCADPIDVSRRQAMEPVFRTARVGSCCNGILLRVQDRCPDLAAIKRTLPRRAAERQRVRGRVVRVGIGAEEMRDDLECLPKDGLEQSCFGASALDRPGRRRRPPRWAGKHTLEFPERGPPKKGNCQPVV